MNKEHKNENTIETVISGSFRKHLSHIVKLKHLLEEEGIRVLSPHGHLPINPKEEFIFLDSDPIQNPELLQSSVFAKIRRSTFLTVANVDGYLGNAAILEIGYAIASGIKIYCLKQVEDPNISPYCTLISEAFPNINNALIPIQQKRSSVV